LYRPMDSSIIFHNVCYKDNCAVPIIEESQKVEVARQVAVSLLSSGANLRVVICDSVDVCREVRRQFGDLFEYEAIDLEIQEKI